MKLNRRNNDIQRNSSIQSRLVGDLERGGCYVGHRKRLREKFKTATNALQDYELLEMLLFYVFRRKDTKQIAKALLSKFQSLRKIIFADKSMLLNVPGVGESTYFLIQTVRELYTRLSFEQLLERPLMNCTDKVVEYYRLILAEDIREQLRVMLLDNKSKMITEKLLQTGTVNESAFYPREIVKMALDYGASAIIIVHNHPSGDPTPSHQDIMITKKLKKTCEDLGIVLFDHIIIGANGTNSFYNKKLI